MVASLGFIMPNATTLALSGHPRTAGSASALLGVLQHAVGAAAAPLVGLGGGSALPMAIVIAVCGVSALAVGVLVAQRGAACMLINLGTSTQRTPCWGADWNSVCYV